MNRRIERKLTSFQESRQHFQCNLDISKLTAHLSDGVLVLTAPKLEKLPPTTQEITIIRGDAPALMEE